MELLKKYWAYLAAAITFVLGLLFYERNKAKGLEADLILADDEKTDAVLKQKQEDAHASGQKEIAEIEAEKKKVLSNKELEDYLRKNL